MLIAALRQSTVSIFSQYFSSVDGQADNSSWDHIFPEATAKATYTILFQEEDAALVDIVKIKVKLAYVARVSHTLECMHSVGLHAVIAIINSFVN